MVFNFLLLLLILVVSITLFYLGKYLGKKSVYKVLSEGTGEFGLVKFNYGYNECYYEVEKIESADNLTKVKLVRISHPSSIKLGDTNHKFNEWVETSQIKWFSDNSKKMRDLKLKKLGIE